MYVSGKPEVQYSRGDITGGFRSVGQDADPTSSQFAFSTTGNIEQKINQDTSQKSVGNIVVNDSAHAQSSIHWNSQGTSENTGSVEQNADQDSEQKSKCDITVGNNGGVGQNQLKLNYREKFLM